MSKDRVFIVCGGPSLDGFDFGLLRNEDTIAVNYAVKFVPRPTYFLTADSGVIKNAVTSKFWNLPKTTKTVVVMNKREHPRWEQVKDYVPKFDEVVVPTRWDGQIGFSWQNFATGKNTGFCALQYAVLLGYKKIYLCGIDLQKKDGRKYFYAKDGGTDSPYDVFYKHFATATKILQDNGDVQVFSCSPVSRLNEHIPYVSIKNVINSMPIFVSHYTRNTAYEDIVKKLVESLERFKLDYDIEGIDTLGSWRLNSNYCAIQVKQMLEKHWPRPVLRLDADAVIQQYPSLFLEPKFRPDVAAAIWRQSKLRPKGELMGGTMYFGNTDKTKKLVELWIDAINKRPNGRNPDLLHGVIQRHGKILGLKFQELPLSYVKIFDFYMQGVDKPVIEHFQASRELKKKINLMGLPNAPTA